MSCRWWRLDCNCRLHCSCRFIQLYDNLTSAERKKKEEEKKKKNKRRRWQERRQEEVKKDSREKEFIEAYVSTLKDRGETEAKAQ